MARLERIDDPMAEEWWEPRPDAVRVDFLTTELMFGAGIAPDMSAEADEAYLELVGGLAIDLDGAVTLRATGYRYGPAAGDADPAFIEIVRTGLDAANVVAATLGVVEWLRQRGALDIRVSEAGIEELTRWELGRRGHTVRELVSLTRRRPERSDWGTTRREGEYVVVARLDDGCMATLILGWDGVLRDASIPSDKS